MDWFDLMSSEHFHVILHSDKKHGLIFNRLDDTIATINYDDAKELSNLKLICRIYGIVGKYLNKYLVLIKNRSFVGTFHDPITKLDHQIYVITEVQVININPTTSGAIITTDNNVIIKTTPRYDIKETTCSTNPTQLNQTDPCVDIVNVDNILQDNAEGSSSDFSSLPSTISTSNYNIRANPWNPFNLANSIRTKMPTQLLKSAGLDTTILSSDSNVQPSPNRGQHLSSSSSSTSTSSSSQQQQQSINQQAALDDAIADKRLIDEMIKLFNNTNSFYFSPTLDLTNRFSRILGQKKKDNFTTLPPIWETADERFFWNKYMLKDLIELCKNDEKANHFVCLILQGFIAIEHHTVPSSLINPMSMFNSDCSIENGLPATSMNYKLTNNEFNNRYKLNNDKRTESSKLYKLALVSRRSVFQAGTRYRRRGCDEEGNCANFVETEQIFQYNQHFNSIILLRGSIPLYWYQTGFNYRPPPVMFRDEEENHTAFSKHFKNLIETYETDRIIAIDCTEQTGREKNLHEAYRLHMDRLRQSHPRLKLIEFDFHKHCRGRQCSDPQVEKHLRSCGLSESLLNDVKYYWNDGELVWKQEGVFRVNCLDCSDRTNVVQRAIALQILDFQLARLGVIAPDTCPEDNDCRRIMQTLWSTNGNILSTQYCGTRALFTGDKKLSGYLKDTYSSASRYYISKFRDAYRQAAIDAMLGIITPDDCNNMTKQQSLSEGGASSSNQFELINLDSIYVGKSGGAILKDVGNRVSNRLARLKGKFYVKPSNYLDSGVGMTSVNKAATALHETDTDSIEDEMVVEGGNRISKTLDGLNIDWPSTESIVIEGSGQDSTKAQQQQQSSQTAATSSATTSFSQLSNNSDDNFQDDEISQLMLSIDLAELQRMRDEQTGDEQQQREKENSEEIDLRESRGSLKGTTLINDLDSTKTTTNTTST